MFKTSPQPIVEFGFNRRLAAVLAGSAVVLLQACGSNPHRCALPESNRDACASTGDAYKASLALPKDTQGRTSAFDFSPGSSNPSGAATQQAAAPANVPPAPVGYPAAAAGGMPVFEAPKVFRPWLAPYVDADGNLRSGEYGYFSTPGRWNYGTLRRPGVANLQGPARPDNLGFAPAAPAAAQARNAPPRPAEGAAAAPGQQPPAQAQADSRPRTPAGEEITQPYQRLRD